MSCTERAERIEKILRDVEDESERRAQTEVPMVANVTLSNTSTKQAVATTTRKASGRDKERRRGSISISRFGQSADPSMEPIITPSPSVALAQKASAVMSRRGFYQVQTNSPSARGSADSFESEDDDHLEDIDDHLANEEHVTQMATIAGRPSISRSVSGMISRRLSRSRTHSRDMLSPSPLSAPMNLFADVSVEVTVEAEEHTAASDERPTSTSVVFSPAALQHRRSRLSMSEKNSGATGSWVSKAKDLTMRLRRKSTAALTQGAVAAPQ